MVRPSAGKDIKQRLIRLNPQDKSKVQSLNPNKEGEVWEDGPRLGKFLQDQLEWELFDIVQRESEAKNAPSANQIKGESRYRTLKDLANRVSCDADDLYERGDLRVIISRDPQKIGEMSTGQRWRSCMATDGVNFRYVPRDIKAGSLVAYIVHKDDVEARYPLMRQLIKPFENKKGEVVLVPAKIYGGEGSGSSKTCDALQQTLNRFVARQNKDKSGEFVMNTDPDFGLYADGQAVVVRLQDDWSPQSTQEALRRYRDGGLQEWMTELKFNMERHVLGHRGQHNEDPMDNVRDLRNRIQRSFTSQDLENGLPRMFFREMMRSSIGSRPAPNMIVSAAADDEQLKIRDTAFNAAIKGDSEAWAEVSTKLPSAVRFETVLAAVLVTSVALPLAQIDANRKQGEALEYNARKLTAEMHGEQEKAAEYERKQVAAEKSARKYAESLDSLQKSEEFALSLWTQEAYDQPLSSIAEVASQYVASNSRLAEALLSVTHDAIDGIESTPQSVEAVGTILDRVRVAGHPANVKAGTFILDNISKIPTSRDRYRTMNAVYFCTATSSSNASDGAVNAGRELHQRAEEMNEEAERFYRKTDFLKKEDLTPDTLDFVVGYIPKLIGPEERMTCAEQIIRKVPNPSSHYSQLLSIMLDSFPLLPDAETRIKWARDFTLAYSQDSSIQEKIGEIILKDIPALSDVGERLEAACDILEASWVRREGTRSYKDRLAELILKNASSLSDTGNHLQALRSAELCLDDTSPFYPHINKLIRLQELSRGAGRLLKPLVTVAPAKIVSSAGKVVEDILFVWDYHINQYKEQFANRSISVQSASKIAGATGWVTAPMIGVLGAIVEASTNNESRSKAALGGLKVTGLNVLSPGLSNAYQGLRTGTRTARLLNATESVAGTSATASFALATLTNGWNLHAAVAIGVATFVVGLAKDIAYVSGFSQTGGPLTGLVTIGKNAHGMMPKGKNAPPRHLLKNIKLDELQHKNSTEINIGQTTTINTFLPSMKHRSRTNRVSVTPRPC